MTPARLAEIRTWTTTAGRRAPTEYVIELLDALDHGAPPPEAGDADDFEESPR